MRWWRRCRIVCALRAAAFDALYASAQNVSAAPGTQIPLNATTVTPGSTLSVSGGVVELPAGTYLVGYGFRDAEGAGAEAGVEMILNGAKQSGSTLSAPMGDGAQATVLMTAATASGLSLYTAAGEGTVTFGVVDVTVLKIA